MKKIERGLFELYQDDGERADYLIFGRRTEANRRGFLKGAGLAAMGAAVGTTIPFARNMPGGLIPAVWAEGLVDFVIPGTEGLTVLSDRPVNAETPPYLLNDAVTPNARHFIRNNGLVPEAAKAMDASGWSLTIDGEVERPLRLSLVELKTRFEHVTQQLQLECGGNGRAAFNPPARGNQWTLGAIGCSNYTGVRVRDVLNAAGLKNSAVYTAHYGSDIHLSGDPERVVISRGAPMAKMMDPHSLIVWEMNGEPLPSWHGFPVRLLVPGWPGSVSAKWLKRIWVRDRVHDSPKMGGTSYRVPWYPVEPGAKVPKEDWRIIESMPVKSLITNIRAGARLRERKFVVSGHAWAGDHEVRRMEVSFDYGASWIRAELDPPVNRYAWQNWRATVRVPKKGYYEIAARASDDLGLTQPFAVTWNAKGYLNNSMHSLPVFVDV